MRFNCCVVCRSKSLIHLFIVESSHNRSIYSQTSLILMTHAANIYLVEAAATAAAAADQFDVISDNIRKQREEDMRCILNHFKKCNLLLTKFHEFWISESLTFIELLLTKDDIC